MQAAVWGVKQTALAALAIKATDGLGAVIAEYVETRLQGVAEGETVSAAVRELVEKMLDADLQALANDLADNATLQVAACLQVQAEARGYQVLVE
jgi:cytochrome c553